MSPFLLYFVRREGRQVSPRFLRRWAPFPPRVSSPGGTSSLFEVSSRRSEVRRFESSDSLYGLLRLETSLPPSVCPSGMHLFHLKFSRVGGTSTSSGLLEWAASRPPPVFSSGRHLCLPRFSRVGGVSSHLGFFDGGRLFLLQFLRRGAIPAALTSTEPPKTFELSKSRSAVRRFDRPIRRSAP